ncbi:MAG: flagellin [Lachnospiraceae bacterium]
MKINHNMSAYIANSHLLKNEGQVTASLEKLSSGFRINHASDDASGMAISSKMRSQIAGLNQASRNASDGISVIETAEGALSEVTSMIQRMRELSVQAGNDTYTEEDRDAIQKEITQLQKEVDRVSKDTEFNKKTLLDGSLSKRVYGNSRDISLIEVSDTVKTGTYELEITRDAEQGVVTGKQTTAGSTPKGVVTINGVEIHINEQEDSNSIYEKLRAAAETAEVNILPVKTPLPTIDNAALVRNPQTGGYEAAAGGYVPGQTAFVLVSEEFGSSAGVSIKCDNKELADFLGFTTTEVEDYGTNAEGKVIGAGYSAQATFEANGRSVTVSDRNGFNISFDVEAASVAKGHMGTPPSNLKVSLSVMDVGTMVLQIGANEHQTISVDIPDMSAKALRIRDLDVTTIYGADKSIAALDKALAKVSSVRSKLGANQNRLNYAVGSLDGTEENMTGALSRIEDVDMAEEMSTYTQMNVLTQAATSVLAQANDIPEQVLQLLQ